jgi:hypothetical protein
VDLSVAKQGERYQTWKKRGKEIALLRAIRGLTRKYQKAVGDKVIK